MFVHEDPLLHVVYLLGTLPSKADQTKRQPAIVSLQRTHFVNGSAENLVQEFLEEIKAIESNDIVKAFILLC